MSAGRVSSATRLSKAFAHICFVSRLTLRTCLNDNLGTRGWMTTRNEDAFVSRDTKGSVSVDPRESEILRNVSTDRLTKAPHASLVWFSGCLISA